MSRASTERIIDMEYEDNLIQLIDEDGQELNFEHIMTFDYEEKQYIVLTPVDEAYYDEDDEDAEEELAELDGAQEEDFDEYDEDDEEGELIILEVAQDDDGNDVFLSIEDDDLLDELYNVYIQTAESLEE